MDWIEYRHWQADRGAYGPIRDFTPYNGADVPGENRVHDLMLELRRESRHRLLDAKSLVVRVNSGADDRFVRHHLPGEPGQGTPEARR